MFQSPDIGQNSDGGISDFQISDQYLIKRNDNNSRTSDDIDRKLGQVTKLDKRNKPQSKDIDGDVMWRQIVKSLDFFQFTVNLEQSGSRIPDAQSVKLIFSLIVTFRLTKTENRTKRSLRQLSRYCFEQCTILAKKRWFFAKKMLTSVKLRGPWYKKVYFLKLQISEFWHNSNKF